MKRTIGIWLGLTGLLAVMAFAGCEGGAASDSQWPADLVGFWEKTQRTVDGVAEVPITVPLTYCLNADGSYSAFDGAGYSESGTWAVRGQQLVINMTSNSLGGTPRELSATLSRPDVDHFTLTYDSVIGPGSSIRIVETFTRTV